MRGPLVILLCAGIGFSAVLATELLLDWLLGPFDAHEDEDA